MDEEKMEAFRKELTKTFFLSILKDLSEIGEPLSDFEVKVLIQKALAHSPDLQVEWGEMDRFGNSTLLVKYESNLLLIEASQLISTIRILWNEYKSKED
ncbi:hypothetical protein ND861_07275 [Leptospira sp. 2 VSF19]|uniref:Uncharacterized protein n=1 Tax=Leptospira soteropolitanensis TaxID=2950025 RepID=A0AAW5VKX0_9LEPT|nr:hypothetical protein [Leptospira soteropolitanensis]MCW7492796.1 hypothetical protein [Leptospira soteropolitanensis]MCW7500031.1 hypothetical protein [Leptospira soteropolitanensis]MCW7522282.1 hypothetical protein [Leptospira soteropolitanensis]MCW7526138.1 hypothetical protein [Leptospira soteropolitanensis]MCW7529750.1 hypothetical protein [Leptospira soteropolitanensis]